MFDSIVNEASKNNSIVNKFYDFFCAVKLWRLNFEYFLHVCNLHLKHRLLCAYRLTLNLVFNAMSKSRASEAFEIESTIFS